MNEHKYFKFIGDGSISRDGKGEYSNHVYAQCPYTNECRNDQCFLSNVIVMGEIRGQIFIQPKKI